jgi:DNA repair photolyase
VSPEQKATVELMLADRKAAVLAPSILKCLSGLPTINLTSGCAHRCLYCYARGYSQFPGENKVVLYANTFDKLRNELPRKRKKPLAVYFSPSTDAFQSVPEVLDLGFRCMEFLLAHGVGVAILTKGLIPDRHMELFSAYPQLVQAQIGVTTVDTKIQSVFEPCAALPAARMEQMTRLVKAGICTQARLDPILPGLTDDDDGLNSLFGAIAATGVTDASVATLFLRPTIVGSLRRNLSQHPGYLKALMSQFANGRRLPLYGEKGLVMALSAGKRSEIYTRVGEIARTHGITIHVCACKNSDLPSERCNIAGTWNNAHEVTELPLFDC